MQHLSIAATLANRIWLGYQGILAICRDIHMLCSNACMKVQEVASVQVAVALSRNWKPAMVEGMPDVFSGGWVGYCGYDTVRYVYSSKPLSSQMRVILRLLSFSDACDSHAVAEHSDVGCHDVPKQQIILHTTWHISYGIGTFAKVIIADFRGKHVKG